MTDPRKPYADALRAAGLDFNRDGVVAAFDALMDLAGVPKMGTARHELRDPTRFFMALRRVTGPLDQVQVDTINRLLASAAHWPTSWLAYGLATAWHEARFKPQPEWGRGKGRPYGAPGKYGQPQYGRGLVQLTWDANYEWADKALGLNSSLLKNFDRALEPEIAAAILVKGMEEGAFAKDAKGRHSLSRHLPDRRGTEGQFIAARRIINGTDKAATIAGYAERFQDAVVDGGWS